MPDRLADLVADPTLNGIDFVEIANAAQTLLRVHFVNVNAVSLTGSPAGDDHRGRADPGRARRADRRRGLDASTTRAGPC